MDNIFFLGLEEFELTSQMESRELKNVSLV